MFIFIEAVEVFFACSKSW